MLTETSENRQSYTLISDVEFVSLSVCVSCAQVKSVRILEHGGEKWSFTSDNTFDRNYQESVWKTMFGVPKQGTRFLRHQRPVVIWHVRA
jgi:hypothetical protein